MNPDIVASPTEMKLIALLGKGYKGNEAAQAVGVTEGFVSQCLSEDWFAQEVAALKLKNLQKHQLLDEKYDDFEEEMLDKLRKMSKLLIKPMEIAKVLQIANGAKRKSHVHTDHTTLTQNIVQLTIPPALAARFVSNANSQVVEVHDGTGRSQALVTVTSGQLEELSREINPAREFGAEERLDYVDGPFESRSIGREEAEESSGNTAAEIPKSINASSVEALYNEHFSGELASKRLKESLRSTVQITAEDL